jgi:MSHA biogenesis protein MshP
MFPEKIQWKNSRSRGAAAEHGFSVITAIFLLVVMASLGAAMLTFSSVQQATGALDLQGIRAYQAARAGVEFGVYKVLRPGVASCGSTTLTLSGSLAAFTNSVDCSASVVYTEGSNTVTVYSLTSTAKSQGVPGSANYVERRLTVSVSR